MTGASATGILIAASEVDERLLECLASCRATFVRTFEDAQRALREELFGLIVIDLDFDNLRMFDLLRHVRSLACFNGVPVLCIQGAEGGAGITAALDRVVRTLTAAELAVDVEPARGRLCILIIDRDVDAAHRLGEELERIGHEVDFAYDAAAGLDAARRLRPDAVFIDLALRSADAYQLAGRLRRESNSDRLLLIALAGATDGETQRRIREAGFDHHLAKCADRQSVLSLLQCWHAHPAA